MPNTFTENSFASTYKDDWKDSDHYHRILFNSGRALQARELTQMQTIIQEEIAKFGRNIFKDGASVNPGGPTIKNNVEFVKLNTTTGAIPTTANALNKTLTGQTSGIVARVNRVEDAEGSDPATLYIQYTNTESGTAGAEIIRFTPGETITDGSTNFTVQTTNTAENPATGLGTQISCGAGDFFARGHFVFAEPQTIVLSKYTQNPTAIIGFKITEDIVTASDNDALFDNQGVTPNRSSPGADRYRIRLELANKEDVTGDDNFIFYCNVINGKIVEQVSATSDYNAPAELLAQSLNETNGNFIAKPFRLEFAEDSSIESNIVARVAPGGVAYVNGYRAAAEAGAEITIPRPRTTVEIENDIVGVSYGNYVIADEIQGNVIDTFAKQNLSTSTSNPAGNIIGTARIRYVEEDGSNFKAYLFDIKMDTGQSFRDTRTIGTDANNFIKLVLESSNAIVKEPTNKSLLFPLTHIRPDTIEDVSFEVQEVRTSAVPSSTTSFTLGATGTERFANTAQWFVTSTDSGGILPGVTFSLTGGGTGVTVNNVPSIGSTKNYAVYTKVNKPNAQSRQKTLTETTLTSSSQLDSDGLGLRYFDLHRSDLYEVLSIKEDDSAGRDISANFEIDDGQRAGFYGNARYILAKGVTPPSTLFTRFKHFTHGAGDFFDVTSYTGQVNYNQIPNFVKTDGSVISLRNVIDFRSSVDSAGDYSGTRAAANFVPTTSDAVQADVSYYLGRTDKVVINHEGTLKVVQGQPGFVRQEPGTPAGTLHLFTVDLPPYVLNDSDVSQRFMKYKRFQMKDIARLEERVDNIQEDLALSFLELDTSTLLVQDSSGGVRTKSGFFVDNFQNRNFSDTISGDYRAGIDLETQTVSTGTITHAIDMVYDSDTSSNTVIKGDNVYLNYTHLATVQQNLVSGVENVNPFAVVSGEGQLTLSPASDTWVEETYAPAKVEDGGTEEIVTRSVINEGELTAGTANTRAGRRLDWVNRTVRFPLVGFFLFRTSFRQNFNLNIGGGFIPGLLPQFTRTIRSPQSSNWNGTNNTGRVTQTGQRDGGRRSRIPRRKTITSFSQRVVISEFTRREEIGDRSLSLEFIPFMRSRKVNFTAQGLRPRTRYFAFFDGKDVSAYVREETAFERHGAKATLTATYGQKNRNATAHPEGATNLITDDNGIINGSFFIPSRDGFKFKAGTREFKLLDISVNQNDASSSRAMANFFSQGELDVRQKTFRSTRVQRVGTRRWEEVTWSDPLAQSFRTPVGNGMFVTKVDVFMNKNGETVIPLQMQIRPMENGSPSANEILPGAIKYMNAADVVDNGSSTTQAQVLAKPTTFEFDEPIYLNPDEEYCVVLLADTTNYEAYVAETYAFELGSTEKRISRQPSMGSLFKSQNGTTWTPDQTKDMTFTLYKAQFSTAGGYATYENRPIDDAIVPTDGLFTENGSATVTLLYPGHGFTTTDTVKISGLDSATTYNGITGANMMGNKTITKVDAFGIQFTAGSSATSTGRFGGDDVLTSRQFNYDYVYPMFDVLQPEDTTVSYEARFLTGSSLAGSENRYNRAPDIDQGASSGFDNDIEVKENNLFDAPRIIATETKENAIGEKSALFRVRLDTIDADVGPYVDGQRTSLILEANRIDKQTSGTAEAGVNNSPISYVAETDPRDGSAAAKHITSVQTVPAESVGLKVILNAVRPNESTITTYYRTADGDEDIFDKNFIEVSTETSVQPDEFNAVEYRYLIGGDGGDLTPFTQYQLKFVLESTNQSKVPTLVDLRAIALAT
jgi:hypothetical protein